METMINYVQQGDVLLFNESFLARGKKKVAGDLLHKGENHSHRLCGGAFQIFTDGTTRFVSVTRATTLTHDEHKPIRLEKGEYRMGIVLERDHFLEESRQVVD
jgi:hypothetical protein